MIAVSPDTHEKLMKLGNMGDTMDYVISRLLEPRHIRLNYSELKKYQCPRCGTFISTVHDSTGFECPECKQDPGPWIALAAGDF